MNLYSSIKELRTMNKWSQDELAKKLGYTSRSSIAKIEAGEVDLSQSKILDFARVFNVTPQYLMGLDEAQVIPEAQNNNEWKKEVIELLKQQNELLSEIKFEITLLRLTEDFTFKSLLDIKQIVTLINRCK